MKIGKIILISMLLCLVAIQSAFAGNTVWKPAVDTSYDLSFPGTILMYKDELSQGGLNLGENEITSNKNLADIVFDSHPDIAARGVIDLGSVDFNSVYNIPDDGYSTDIKANSGHVYIVLTHDDGFAKILVKSIVGQKVMIKYALVDYIEESPQTDSSSSVNNNSNNQTINNSTNNTYIDNSKNTQIIDNSSSLILQLNKKEAIINGKRTVMDAAPFTENGRTLVPLRFVSIGGKVDWDANKQSITISLNNSVIVLYLNQKNAYVNGKLVKMEVPAKLYNKRTMVPIRFVSENLGKDVNFDSKTGKINVKANKGVSNKSVTTSNANTNTNAKTNNNSDLADFFHLFKLVVPGAVNEIPVGFNAVIFKATPGALAGAIAIYSDGTYIWNSPWDGKVIKGRWKRSEDAGYPITIVNGEEGKNWACGKANSSTWGGGDIILWDGNIWKNGTKVK